MDYREFRDRLGRIVRAIWIDWAAKQPDVKDHPSWLLPWGALSERDREIDRHIGEKLYLIGFHDCDRLNEKDRRSGTDRFRELYNDYKKYGKK